MFKAGFSWFKTCFASFEVSDANALRYCRFMLHLHHITVIITKLLSKAQAAEAYSLYMCFAWNFGSERFIRLCMGI